MSELADELSEEDTRILPPSESPLDRLKATYEKLQAKHHVDLEIPGYGGRFVGRYVLIPKDKVDEKARLYDRLPQAERMEAAALDQIIEACDSLWMRNDADELEPLDADDPSLKYSTDLAAKLGVQVKSARQAVKVVFTVGGEYNAAAMLNHARAIGTWMQDVSREVDPSFLGE